MAGSVSATASTAPRATSPRKSKPARLSATTRRKARSVWVDVAIGGWRCDDQVVTGFHRAVTEATEKFQVERVGKVTGSAWLGDANHPCAPVGQRCSAETRGVAELLSATFMMRRRVSGFTLGSPASALDTVDLDTDATAATSPIVGRNALRPLSSFHAFAAATHRHAFLTTSCTSANETRIVQPVVFSRFDKLLLKPAYPKNLHPAGAVPVFFRTEPTRTARPDGRT